MPTVCALSRRPAVGDRRPGVWAGRPECAVQPPLPESDHAAVPRESKLLALRRRRVRGRQHAGGADGRGRPPANRRLSRRHGQARGRPQHARPTCRQGRRGREGHGHGHGHRAERADARRPRCDPQRA
eukprot:3289303-Prymnesium_polylepis.1